MSGPLDELSEALLRELCWFCRNLTTAPRHAHLYDRFDSLLAMMRRLRESGATMDPILASNVLDLVGLLVDENAVGRRPWGGNWEVYFGKCMSNALALLSEYCQWPGHDRFIPLRYAERFLESFTHMDFHSEHYIERGTMGPQNHFLSLATTACRMFSLTADSAIRFDYSWLEHPDDTVFTLLLTGLARSRTPEAHAKLRSFLEDDERWVRDLAARLLERHFD